MYDLSLVSIIIMSFSAINIGTTTSNPVSQVTVLVDEVTVSPLTAGSAFVTLILHLVEVQHL